RLLQPMQGAGHVGVPTLIRPHHTRNRISGDTALVGIADQRLTLERGRKCRIERHRLDADVGMAEAEAMKAPDRRGILTLFPAGEPGLDRLDLTGVVSNVLSARRLLSRTRQRAHQSDAERA